MLLPVRKDVCSPRQVADWAFHTRIDTASGNEATGISQAGNERRRRHGEQKAHEYGCVGKEDEEAPLLGFVGVVAHCYTTYRGRRVDGNGQELGLLGTIAKAFDDCWEEQ